MRTPKADTVEVLEVTPRTMFVVAGAAVGFYAWRGDMIGVRCSLILAGLSFALATALHVWHNQLDAAERNAVSAAQRARRHGMSPGRATVTARLPEPEPRRP